MNAPSNTFTLSIIGEEKIPLVLASLLHTADWFACKRTGDRACEVTVAEQDKALLQRISVMSDEAVVASELTEEGANVH